MLYLFNVYALVVIAISIVALAVLLVAYASVMSAAFIARLLHTAAANSKATIQPAATDLSSIRIPDDLVEG